MLKSLLNEKTVEVKVKVKDWQEAVKAGGKLLEEDGKIEHRYIEAMIETVNKVGPYIVIAPGIAMPRARPECGAKEIGMSLLTLETPVAFGNEEYDPVDIVILFCAVDNTSHIKLLSEFMQIIEDEDFLELARKAESSESILQYVKNKEYR
ncbi:PTS sugar transporter subunit IIA [Clostridium polynesiense]|uniref:PTS sugar transporter subunit IIA n=1 Tax=Clostridium polynesiense TaxID=1325933 RepID=UPI00058DE703|nr:PTS sugar transporter subunit IIA [Clostridium polynesiense]